MNALLAKGGWVLDILFFAIIILGILLGVRRGFVKGVCKIAGTILSVAVAITFCVAVQASLERNFGATTSLNNAVGEPFGQWIMVALSFILLLVAVKLGCWLLGSFGSAIMDSVAPLRFSVVWAARPHCLPCFHTASSWVQVSQTPLLDASPQLPFLTAH